ncbi:sensor histidine kinase [Hyalangium minutum]|uniref:histidine kinase n=1 Tax=Hyalangium minutum TaxID=394096 RepID=A0A085WPM1_9BACT|nr:ATP-binding protein [Hyalangium minutum]KFE69634.1 nitrogen regulation protein NtrB [Hyalangium minutum]
MRISRNASLLTALALLLMLGGVTLYSFFGLRRAMARLDLITQEVLLGYESSAQGDELLRALSDVIVARDAASQEQVSRTLSSIQRQLTAFAQSVQSPEARRDLESLRRMTRTCGEQSQRIFLLAQEGHIPEAVAVKDEVARVVQFMKEDLTHLMTSELTYYRERREELSARAARMAVLIVTTTGVILLGCLLLLGFAFRDELLERERLNAELEQRVRARSLELEEAQRQLVEAAHLAGRAEVAVSMLHNVGNVLNSVNINAHLTAETLRRLPLNRIARTGQLIAQHRDEPGWLKDDPRGKVVPGFLSELGQELEQQRDSLVDHQREMLEHVEHIKQIIAVQNTYAGRVRLLETISLVELIELALRINHSALFRHEVTVERHFEPMPEVQVEKHKVLQILVNLISNAYKALAEGRETGRRLTLRLGWGAPHHWRIEVEDNGLGITPDNLEKLFFFGFTTRKDGHGIGLHSCALAAQEMKGTLVARSEGLGHGACFILEVPLEQEPS